MKALTQRLPTSHLPPVVSTRPVVGVEPRSLVRRDRLRPFGLCFVLVMLLFGRGEMNGAGGSVIRRLGNPIPDSTQPGGGYQLTGLKVVIEPAEARAAGATWRLQNDTKSRTSGDSLLLLVSDAGKQAVQFSTVSKFEAPIQPIITLTRGFETIVTFTYARTLPPVLPESANFEGTRSVAFSYRPPVTGGAPTSFAVTVGGGESLEKLGLALNAATGRLTGTPAKKGTFSMVFTATNAAGKSDPMTLTLNVSDPGQLVVQADAARGSVTVSPNRPDYLFAQSDKVVLTAKPKLPGYLFSGWQFMGATPTSLTSQTTSFSFSPTQLMVTAIPDFVVNPFLTRADTYSGRIAPLSGVALTNTGTLSLTTTTLGQYTGKLKLGTGTYSLKGQFQPDGVAPVMTIKRPNQTPPLSDLLISQLQMDLAAGGSEQITGQLAADGNTISFVLDRAVFDARENPCPQSATDPKTGGPVAARYTLALLRDPAKAADQYPQGHGGGVAIVNPDGRVRFTGTLGDGTALSQSGVISKTGGWPFHALLYKNGGVLTGDLTFREIVAASDLDGTLDWIKPALAGATVTYAPGFTTVSSLIGSRYDKTVPVPNGTLSFGAGNLGVLLNPLPVTSALGLWTASPAVAGFSARPAQATGLFKGTLPAAALIKTPKFQGVIFQKTQSGYGSFIGAPLPAGAGLPTGYVEFAAP